MEGTPMYLRQFHDLRFFIRCIQAQDVTLVVLGKSVEPEARDHPGDARLGIRPELGYSQIHRQIIALTAYGKYTTTHTLTRFIECEILPALLQAFGQCKPA